MSTNAAPTATSQHKPDRPEASTPVYLTPLYANPRRRRRRYYRRYRRNPAEGYGFENPRRRRRRYYRRNPSFLGIDMGDAGGTIIGAIGTAYADSAVIGPLLGRVLGAAGSFKPAVQAVAAAFGTHWALRRLNPAWARATAGGGALYAVVGIANTIAPGLVPITIGVPTQLQGLRPLAALQPPAPTAPAGAPTGTQAVNPASPTTGLRIMSRNGL